MEQIRTINSMAELDSLATDELLDFALDGNVAFEQIQDELNYRDRPASEHVQKLYLGLASIALLCDRWIEGELHVAHTIPKQKLGDLLRSAQSPEEIKDIRNYYDETYIPPRSVLRLQVTPQVIGLAIAKPAPKKKFVTEVDKKDPQEVAVERLELLKRGAITLDSYTDYANCSGVDPEIFYPNRNESTKEAKDICASCVVRPECLETALVNREELGVRGGKDEYERRSISRQRGRARRTSTSAVG